MDRFTLPVLSLLLLTPACDTEASSQSSERSDEGARGLDRRVPRMVGMLCNKLDCSDEQEAELVAIAHTVAADREQRAPHDESLPRFADAFRADTLDADAVAEFRAMRVTDLESIRDAALAAHQLLSSDQRDQLAELIENFGPPPVMAGRTSDAAPATMAEHVARHLCKVARCEGRQRAQIEMALSGVSRPSEDEVAAMKARVASAIRADDLDPRTLEVLVADLESKRATLWAEAFEVTSEVHTILTRKQRDALATTLEEEGPRGLIGAPGFHGRI